MTTRLRGLLVLLFAIPIGAATSARPARGALAATVPLLRVCADPDNLPFSNARGEGFENRLAEMLARDLGTGLEYAWWAQRRGFLRETLQARRCDVVMGLPTRFDAAWTTRPYYRSSYVFLERRDRRHGIASFDDARLRGLRIGVPLVSDDGANAPPAHALASRGLGGNLVRVSVYRDGTTPAPGARLVAAVARGDVDVAAAWGPVAGYFAARQRVPLRITPVSPQADGPLVQVFDMSMATRRGDGARRAAIDAFLDRRRAAIDRLLASYHVPRLDAPAAGGAR